MFRRNENTRVAIRVRKDPHLILYLEKNCGRFDIRNDFELSSYETEKIMFLWVPGAASATGVTYFVIMTCCLVALTLS
jgi:hypothetical protein